MNAACDLLILGGGPSGCAAGISACQDGLNVMVLETRGGPRVGPGETLHPGSSAVFQRLGVARQVEAVSTLRPAAQRVVLGEDAQTTAYGGDPGSPWRGYQILRSDLSRILLTRFEELGGEVVRIDGRPQPIRKNDVVLGLRTPDLTIESRYTIDATGGSGVLRRALNIRQFQLSPPLFAHYGYRRGLIEPEPTFAADTNGWSWTAQVAPEIVCWVRLSFQVSKARLAPPERVAHLPGSGTRGAVDVTWRIAETVAGPGFFIIGDAAAILDPAASHGVLRAMMSGMMAAFNAVRARAGEIHPDAAAIAYTRWITAWFQRDASALRALYRRIGVDWVGFAFPGTSAQIGS